MLSNAMVFGLLTILGVKGLKVNQKIKGGTGRVL